MSTTQSPAPPSDAAGKPPGAARESAEVVLGLLNRHLDVRSVLDVGCGAGAWLSAARELGVPSVAGVDDVAGTPEGIDPAGFHQADLNEAFDLGRAFDLVVSIETASRLRPASSATFVRSLARHGGTVLFSAAIPGQGGPASINEGWPESWVALFEAEGYAAFDVVRRGAWGDGRVEPAVQQNALLFIRGGEPVPESLEPFRVAGEPAAMVHRVTYNRALRRVGQLKQELKGRQEAESSALSASPAASFQERIARQATALQVAELIADKLRSETPCSLVRLSHCESKFINWPDVFVRAEINKSLRRQFGYADLTDVDIGAIAARIRGAVTSSDIVGVPVLSAADKLRMEEGDYNYMLWSKVAPACERYNLLRADAVVTSPNIHLRLQDSDFLERMVEASPTLTLIGCRDLRVPFRRLGFTDVEHIPVPEAYRTRQRDIPVQRHYPDAFDEIVTRIRTERRRGLFFVGAGVLGKVYCQEVRLAGGVAIDVGSVMDVWAGVVSRTGFEKRVEMYALEAR